MLDMSERESSDMWRNQPPAHKAPGRVEAKELREHSAEVRTPQQQLWDAHRRFHSIQQKSMHRKRDKEDSRQSAEDQYCQNLDARAGTPAQQCERHRDT